MDDNSNIVEIFIMSAKIQQWGNSLGVRIPQRLTKKYGLVNGLQVKIQEDVQRIILQPMKDEFTLEELLAQCKSANPNEELFAESIGKENL